MSQVRRSREFWAKLSAETDAGASCAAVAERWGVSRSTLSWWRSHLRRDVKQRFLPVVTQGSVPSGPVGAVMLHVGDVRVAVEVGTDVRYVSELVAALRAC